MAYYYRSSLNELHVSSGKNCLIIVLGENYFFTDSLFNESNARSLHELFVYAIDNHITSGDSAILANLIGIKLTDFPCALFFTDIRAKEFVFLPLKGLRNNEISILLRKIFDSINATANKPNDILPSINRLILLENLHSVTTKVPSLLFSLVEKSIETAINAWINAVLK